MPESKTLEQEIDARLARIAAARNLVNIPDETIAVLRAIGEMYIAQERAEVEKLIAERDGAPAILAGIDARVAALKLLAQTLGVKSES